MVTTTKIPMPGDTSSNVGLMQKALNEKGFSVSVDNVFGPKTRAAVSAFQKSIGLPGSGVPGEKTMTALEIKYDPTGGKITSGVDIDEGTPPWYRRMFFLCEIDPGKESQTLRTIDLIDRGLGRYLAVSKRLGFQGDYQMIFAYILGCLHYKEASCNFQGVLHNGEQIIGTGKKTTLVPSGRGPFGTWEDSAFDAINLNSARWAKLRAGSTDIGDILYAMERFNGTGYINGAGQLETSPYLWDCSNINDGRGRYTSDGKFDSTANGGGSCGAALLLKELYKAGLFKCTGVESKPVIPLPDISPKPPGSVITRQMIADKIVEIIQRDVDAELRETNGKNRSPRIDEFNRRAKSYMGAPYCASGGWCAIDDACKALGLKNPVIPTASSQAFASTEYIPKKYLKPDGTLGKKGDVGVLRSASNAGLGHYTTLKKDQESFPKYESVEYNTDGSGSRDGDGAYSMTRSTSDYSWANSGKIFVCFTDIPQWILEHNSKP